ncbi:MULTISPECIES: DUF945 family protein [unclassified Pseudocitrobacter]|uniref:DUF945 family protein n=1 Tax=unclassified Pseudocitrobacter TaxID=2638778 RepID=UPI0023E355F2|nr:MULTISPECIES: DUF945 family protein [unclassified Pseudocitrobacter]MDF3826976.1 DUF945 family protein [Pseudocitrobacter sp. 2023EL-00150]MEC5372395.1 DUF945 family protein [Pseudocitrobacter sp. MW920760]
MKKSVVAAGVVVALGVCWMGSAWYTGKQIEPKVADFVSAFNQASKVKSPQMGMTLSYKDFSSGMLSSHFQVVLTFEHGAEASGIKAGQNVAFNVDVDHGPFPLSSLAKGRFGPAMAAMNVSLVNGEITKPLFDAAKGRSPIDANIRASYDKSIATQLVVAPASYSDTKTTFAFDGGEFNLSGDKLSLADVQIDGQLKNIVISQDSNDVKVYSDSMTMTSTGHTADDNIPVGSVNIALNNIHVNAKGKDIVQINAMTATTAMALSSDKKHINYTQEYGIKDLTREKQNLGSGKIALLLDNLDPAAIRQLFTDYNMELSKAMVANPALSEDEDAMSELSLKLLQKYIANIQKSEPVIKLPISWKNEKGEMTANLNIAIADPAKATFTPGTLTESVDQNVKTITANVMLPLDVFTYTAKQIKLAEGKDDAAAQKQAEKDVKNATTIGKMMDLISVDDKAAKLDFEYQQGNVIFNGKEMTAEEFMARGGRFLQ